MSGVYPLLAENVSGMSRDRIGCDQQSGGVWNRPMEALSVPGGPNVTSDLPQLSSRLPDPHRAA
jgi:hypothetical protein